MPFLTVNGARLYYEEQGSGPETIVFFHSLLFNLRMFDAQSDVLAERYRCVAFDWRGHGRSEVTEGGYDMNTLTADTVALISELDCTPCHYVGFSTGGFVGLRLGIRHPELLRSLILVDTSADPEPEENLPRYRLLNLVARWIGLWAVAGRVMPIMFSDHFLSDPDRAALRREWRQHFLENDRVGATRAVKGVMSRNGVVEHLGAIDVPTLILVGENDVATAPEKSERMHAGIAGSELAVIPRAGHMSPVEEPEAVTAAIEAFLDRV